MMEEWIKAKGPVVKFRILTTQGVAVCDPVSLKRIFQTGQKLYNKDLDLSYKPFLPILGSGLVTADGDLWQKQRLLIGPALRTDILDEIVPIARNATQRLIKKLEHYRGTGQAIDIQKEFHLLTLQVIGEAVLSLAPEQCDRVSAGRMHAASLDCKPGSFLWNKTTPVHLSVLHFPTHDRCSHSCTCR
jgi:cytochrome P450